MKKKLVILTGNEIRHKYFKLRLSLDKRFKVLASYCEGTEQSLTKSIQLTKNKPTRKVTCRNKNTIRNCFFII